MSARLIRAAVGGLRVCASRPTRTSGLVAHLMYQGVTCPIVIGGDHASEP